MKAVCVTPARTLEVKDIPRPDDPPPGHILVDMAACAINPGDKIFLTRPDAAGLALGPVQHAVWGASGAGHVVAAGAGVPADIVGKPVALYRSLVRSPDTIGLWCERAQVSFASCVVLPEGGDPRDYSGSLVNAITAYAFLKQAVAQGHAGAVATAGNSATSLALAALARRIGFQVVFLARSAQSAQRLTAQGVGPVLATDAPQFDAQFAELAAQLRATAVFDGVGGELFSRLTPLVPAGSVFYCYGSLAGATPVSFPTTLLLMKSLTINGFSNFKSPTVSNPINLAIALRELGEAMADPLFRTRVGPTFRLDEIDKAMAYDMSAGPKAALIP